MDYDLINAQSYIPSFDILYKKYSISRVLEFGEGLGTKYLLDNSEFVCSVEVVAKENHLLWADYCANAYKGYSDSGKWVQIVLQCSDLLKSVDTKCQKGIQTNIGEYRSELSEVVDRAYMHKPFDLAFVDYGIHMRADIVNMLFNKVNIICAHDTNVSPEMYGWDRIITPENYSRVIYHQEYLGTTFWVRN